MTSVECLRRKDYDQVVLIQKFFGSRLQHFENVAQPVFVFI
jgi:hypothetical protein